MVRLLENAEKVEKGADMAHIHMLMSQACDNMAICYNYLNQPVKVCSTFESTPTKSAISYFQ